MTRAETAERSIGIETSRRLSFVDIGLLLRIDAVLQPRPVGGRILSVMPKLVLAFLQRRLHAKLAT